LGFIILVVTLPSIVPKFSNLLVGAFELIQRITSPGV
jgi:hypothetical protein